MWVTPVFAAGASVANLDAKAGLAIYGERMKIEQTFRDLKSLLNYHKLMNKRRSPMKKMVASILTAYAIILIIEETLRTQLFPEESRKNKIFSGLFVFLKLKPDLSSPLLSWARSGFTQLVFLSEQCLKVSVDS